MSTLRWVKLRLVPLMGGAALESAFWGGCEFSMTSPLISGAAFLSCWLFGATP